MITVTTALTAFTDAVAAAVNGGKVETAAKKARRAELVSFMRQLAAYVTLTSDGDLEKLLSSGFPYQKPERSRVGILPAPAAPTLRFGRKSGQLDATVSPIYGAGSYNWRIALASAPTTFVQTAQTAGGRYSFPGFNPWAGLQRGSQRRRRCRSRRLERSVDRHRGVGSGFPSGKFPSQATFRTRPRRGKSLPAVFLFPCSGSRVGCRARERSVAAT